MELVKKKKRLEQNYTHKLWWKHLMALEVSGKSKFASRRSAANSTSQSLQRQFQRKL